MQDATFNVALKVWENFAGRTEITDAQRLQLEIDLQKKLLNFFQAGDFYYYIFNVSTAEFEFVSPGIEKVLGYHSSQVSLEFFFDKIHPEDQIQYVNFENEVGKFLHSLPKEKMFSYKIRVNLRIRKNDGNYLKILHQAITIQQNESGKILRTLGVHTDITHLNPTGKPTLSFIGLDGEPSYIDVKIGKPLIPITESLSKREKEILQLIIEGKQNKEIADILFISKQTVDKHRKNMINKNNFKNSGELIAAAIKNGWI